jgi:hypothetical protein
VEKKESTILFCKDKRKAKRKKRNETLKNIENIKNITNIKKGLWEKRFLKK